MKTFYTDTHFCGVNALACEVLTYGEDCYYLGDIVDLRTCLKTEVFSAQDLHASILKMAGKNYVSGNHELCFDNLFIVKDGIYMTHGDYLSWGEKRASSYRKQSFGSGPVSRFFKRLVSVVRETLPVRLSKPLCERAWAEAKTYGCDKVVIGHLHPKKIIKKVYKGVIIYALPRGKTTLPI